MDGKEQQSLFDKESWWGEYWQGMPEFVQERQESAFSEIVIRFDTEEDLNAFAELIGQTLTPKTKSLRYPFRPHRREVKFVYVDEREA